MAFRGYELNLMLRVQDRATTRLRRLSSDLGGIARASQMQADANRAARNAFTTNSRLEQTAAINRLKGLNQATIASDRFVSSLNQAQLAGRLTAAEVTSISSAYDRVLRSERAMTRARIATHVGSVTAMAGGLGLGVAAGASAVFANFNRLAVGAATQMRGVNESFTATVQISKTLETALLDLTRIFPASAAEMAQSIYDIASGMNFQIDRTSKLTETQQRFNQSFNLLKMANKVAVAGNLDLATATDVLITTFNNFDPAVRRPAEILNRLFAIVRYGKGTFADFSPQIGRMAAAANAAGQSLTEAGSALAFLSQRLPLTQATTALTRIFQIMGRKEFTTGFQELFKISPLREGTRQLKDLSELMFIIEKQGPRIWPGFKKGSVDLMNVLQNITAAGQNVMKGTTDAVGLVSTQWARQAITNLVIGGDQYREVLKNVTTTQGEFFRSFQAFRDQPGVRWQIAINQFKAFAIIIGQDVIPVVLKFIDYITRLSHRWEDMAPSTRKMISQFAVWGSILLLVGGAITTIGGAIGMLTARFGGLLTILGVSGTAGVTGRMLVLHKVVRGLLAVGTIKIGIELLKKGDQNLWSTILGSAAQIGGAAFLGSRVAGWQGAAIAGAFAAYSIPLQMAQVEMKKQGIVSEKTINEELQRIKTFQDAVKKVSGGQVAGQLGRKARTILIRAVYRQEGIQGIKNTEKYMKGTLTRMQRDIINYARTTGVSHMFYQGHRAALKIFEQQNAQATQNALERWQDLATSLTGLDVYGGLSQQAATAGAKMSLALAKAQASGNEAAIRKATQAQIAWDKQQIKRLQKMPQTAERTKELIQLYNDIAAQTSALNSLNNKANKITEAGNKAAKVESSRNQVKRDQMTKINDAASKLVEKYKELEAANKKAFEIFTGPISKGPIAQVYNNINQMLMSFGRRPIAIPIKLQIQDIQAQVTNFKRFVEDIAILRKRGLPRELIDQLQAKGPEEGLAIVEGLRAGGGALNTYVNLWKQGQKLVTTTTNQQMNANLKEWQKYGKGIAWQIVQGLADDKTQATLLAGYKKYITNTFKNVLAKEFSAAVGQKVKEYEGVQGAKKGAKAGTSTKPPKPTPTRTTQSTTTINYHGDQIEITASGATAAHVKAAIDRAGFGKRNRR